MKVAEDSSLCREESSATFLVYVAAVLRHKPIFAQPLRFIFGATDAVEQLAMQGAVSIPDFWRTIFILKLGVAFFSGHQIKLLHNRIVLPFCVSSTQLTHSTTNIRIAPLTLAPKSKLNFQRTCALTRRRSVPRECAACTGTVQIRKGLGIPNKHFATQKWLLYKRKPCLRQLCVLSVRVLSLFEPCIIFFKTLITDIHNMQPVFPCQLAEDDGIHLNGFNIFAAHQEAHVFKTLERI